jgi:hypothetical protein
VVVARVTMKRALVVTEDVEGSEDEVERKGRGRDRESEGRWVWQVVSERRENFVFYDYINSSGLLQWSLIYKAPW